MFTSSPAIIWDGYGIQSPYSGIGRHASLLMSALSERFVQPLTLDHSKNLGHRLFSPQKIPRSLESVKLLHFWRLGRDNIWLEDMAAGLRRGQSLVFHGLSNFNIPSKTKAIGYRKILTVHDLIPILAKGKVSYSLSRQFQHLMPKALEAADQVIAVSHWTANSLEDYFPGVSKKIVVIPNGFQNTPTKSTYVPRETSDLHFLSISRYEPYKRFDRLVDIMAKSPNFMKFTVITDLRGYGFLKAASEKFRFEKKLRILQALTEPEMDQCFQEANALLHTSELEGFCLPAAEALVKGLPVIFQKGSGIDEVVGHCGVGMEATASVLDWISLMESRSWDRDQLEIQTWIKNQPSWQKVADMTLRVYNNEQ